MAQPQRDERALSVPRDDLRALMLQAEQAVKSGLLPKTVDRPEKALAIMLRGRELGVPPMVAVGNIYAINQNLMLSAALTEALLKRAGYRVLPMVVTREEARVKFVSPAGDEFVYSVTMEEAVAGKWNQEWNKEKSCWQEKTAWRMAPKVMLLNRAITQGAKMFAAEALLLPPMDEDESFMVYDEQDAEFVTEEEAERREEQRAKDRSLPVMQRPAGRGRLFKCEEPARPARPAPEAEVEQELEVEVEPEPCREPPQLSPFKVFLVQHGLSEAKAKAIAGQWLGLGQPLSRWRDWPHSRERLQRVLLAWLQANHPWSDPETHWVETDPSTLRRFWKTVGAAGYDEVKVHEVIPSLHRWPGTADEAIDFVLYSTPEDRQFPEPDAAGGGDAGEDGQEVLL